MPDNKYLREQGCKEAVCVDAGRVYDSCSDKDCLEDLRVYFTDRDQMIVDNATSIRAKNAEVIYTYIDIESLPFNQGYYACDLTFFFLVEFEVFTGHGCPSNVIDGCCSFQKRVILYGSEGNVKVFSSEFRDDKADLQELPARNLPRCVVQVAQPVVLSARLCEVKNYKPCDYDCGCGHYPENICRRFGGNFCEKPEEKLVFVTLGIFSIVQLVRNVQMLMPAYDYCVPTKDCSCPPTDSPCDLFRKMCFPVNEFFPPRDDQGNCGCDKK